MYGTDDVQRLFADLPTVRTEIRRIARDLFVSYDHNINVAMLVELTAGQ